MSVKPTVEQLATVAAMLDAKLPPDEAVKQALQLFDAADRLLRADEIADQQAEEQVKNKAEREALAGLGGREEMFSMSEAFDLYKEFAEAQGVKTPLKTKAGFIKAMRDAGLTKSQVRHAMTPEEFIKSPETENPVVEIRELTSRRAIEQLFQRKTELRKAADRIRKKKRPDPGKGKSSNNLSRNTKLKKRNKKLEQRKV
jgi:hypothetical protein